MDLICEQALKSGRYAIIFDKTARAEIYFNYKTTMKEFYKDILGVHMQVHDRRQATENIRHSLVYSMRSGDRLVIYLDKTAPDFKNEYNFPPEQWPSWEIFNFEKWRQNDNYMKVVRPDENHDILKNPEKFEMHDNFMLIILATF